MSVFQCGKQLTEVYTLREAKKEGNNLTNAASLSMRFNQAPVRAFSAYTGGVDILCEKQEDTLVLHGGVNVGSKQIYCKIIDCQANNLKPDEQRYTDLELSRCKTHSINTKDMRESYIALMLCDIRLAERESDSKKLTELQEQLQGLNVQPDEYMAVYSEYPHIVWNKPSTTTKQYKEMRRKIATVLAPIDALFHVEQFFEFLYDWAGEMGIQGREIMYCITNVPGLDNAFYDGANMIMGTGKEAFYPLVSADVVAHEISHGLVQGLSGLEYKGHSGALNESFADVLGVAYEFWVYNKFNENGKSADDIRGEADWLLGEDLGATMPYLRSFIDPTLARQPKTYRGQHYCDPNSQVDFGGVHINSGPTNHCFYKLVTQRGVSLKRALQLFVATLRHMQPNSNFMHFRDVLNALAPSDIRADVETVLGEIGLGAATTSDQHCDQGKRQLPLPKERLPSLHQPLLVGDAESEGVDKQQNKHEVCLCLCPCHDKRK